MTALTESQRARRPLFELLAVELAPRDGRWAAVARIATGSAITVAIAMVFQIPQPTYMAYIVFLISKDEKNATVTAGLGALIAADPEMSVTVDLEQQTITRGNRSFAFAIDPVSRNQLLNGWDDVDLTDSHRNRIAAFEAKNRARRPWAQPPRPR